MFLSALKKSAFVGRFKFGKDNKFSCFCSHAASISQNHKRKQSHYGTGVDVGVAAGADAGAGTGTGTGAGAGGGVGAVVACGEVFEPYTKDF